MQVCEFISAPKSISEGEAESTWNGTKLVDSIRCDLYIEFDKRSKNPEWANLLGEIQVSPKVSKLRILVSNIPTSLEGEVREVVQQEIIKIRKNLGWAI